MEKMKVQSLVQLVSIAGRLGVLRPEEEGPRASE
jgi:hypothetical protein